MSNYAEILRMNSEDVENVALAYEWRAKTLGEEGKSKEQNKDRVPLIASSYLISALFNTTFAPDKAIELFGFASEYYRQLDLPVWRLLAICAQQREILDQVAPFKSDADTFYQFLQVLNSRKRDNEIPKSDSHQDFFSWLNIPGRIDGIDVPYRLVISSLAEALQWRSEQVAQPKLTYVSAVLDRFAELMQEYQEDTYHWQHVQGPVIPFEPAALAIAVVFVKIWISNFGFEALIQRFSNQAVQKTTLLQIAYDLIRVKQ
ncbi:hypothetical protein ACFJIV_28895 [Mucilaginibacter sp. UC70_90]